jgi:hypothetical protein
MKITEKNDETTSGFVLINGTHLAQSCVHGDEAHNEASSCLIVNSNLPHLLQSHVHANLSHENDEDHELRQSKRMFSIDCELIVLESSARRLSSLPTMKKQAHSKNLLYE